VVVGPFSGLAYDTRPAPIGGVPRRWPLASGYCVKCKASREMKDPKQITMKNGRPATEGTCPVCGTRMFKIGAPDAGAPARPAAD